MKYLDPTRLVPIRDLIALAAGLSAGTTNGVAENPEYDRALIELIADAVHSAGDDECRTEVAAAIRFAAAVQHQPPT